MSPNSAALDAQIQALRRRRRGSIRDVKDRPCNPHAQRCTRPGRGIAAGRLLRLVLGVVTATAGHASPAVQTPAPPAARTAPSSTASALPPADLARALALAQEAAQRLAPAQAQVTATLGALDARLTPAPCRQADPFLPRSAAPWGRTRVGLRCVDGRVAWTLYLPVQVQVTAPALTTRTALPAGSVITANDLQLTVLDWTARPQPPLVDPARAVGRTLLRASAPGTPLRENDLQAQRWFAAGDTVKVRAVGAGFAVATEGIALTEGRDGQRVRVQLPAPQGAGRNSGPVLQGYAVGEHLVALP